MAPFASPLSSATTPPSATTKIRALLLCVPLLVVHCYPLRLRSRQQSLRPAVFHRPLHSPLPYSYAPACRDGGEWSCALRRTALFANPADDDGGDEESSSGAIRTVTRAISEEVDSTGTEVVDTNDDDDAKASDDGDAIQEEGEGGGMEGLRRKMFGEVEKMRQQFAQLTDSLSAAEEKAKEAAEAESQLREERDRESAAGKGIVSSVKRVFSDEMTDLADNLELAQDDLRRTAAETIASVSAVRSQAKDTQRRLESEISDLEARLSAVRSEAKSAEGERKKLVSKIDTEVREAEKESRQLLDEEMRESFRNRKELTRENWAAETRIDQAKVDLAPAERELEKEKATTPDAGALQGVLEKLKEYLNPQVEELEERRKSNEMMFASSVQKSKADLEERLVKVEEVFETDDEEEKEKLKQTITDNGSRLIENGREWAKNLRISKERFERDLAKAPVDAKKDRIAIYQEKYESVKEERAKIVEIVSEAEKTREVTETRYDAEYENEMYNLERARISAQKKLGEEDERNKMKKQKLTDEKVQVTTTLAQQLGDERIVGESELDRMTDAKSAALAISRSRTIKAKNDVMGARADLVAARSELERIERLSEEKNRALRRLEVERSSFRTQARRTLALAGERLTLKKWRMRRRKD